MLVEQWSSQQIFTANFAQFAEDGESCGERGRQSIDKLYFGICGSRRLIRQAIYSYEGGVHWVEKHFNELWPTSFLMRPITYSNDQLLLFDILILYKYRIKVYTKKLKHNFNVESLWDRVNWGKVSFDLIK